MTGRIILIWIALMSMKVGAQTMPTVSQIKSRGYLKCGVSTGLPGFSAINQNGKWEGFDVDFCKAIAAAILGDANKVEYIPLDAKARFMALTAKAVDVLVRNTTWNLTREASLNILFPAVNFYDGQGVMVAKSTGLKQIHELDGASICVIQGTTSEINLSHYFANRQLTFNPIYFDRVEQMVRSYEKGRCDAITSDRSQLHVMRRVLSKPQDSVVLDEVISKEPLSPVVRDDDPDFSKLVRWVVFATIQAEEWDLTVDNCTEKAQSNADIKKFLGMSQNVAPLLGLMEDYVVKILAGVGNYGQIYERNLGMGSDIQIKRDANNLWVNGSGGLMYAMSAR